MKKFLILLLVSAMFIPCLAACREKGKAPVSDPVTTAVQGNDGAPTHDANGYLLDSLPGNLNYNNAEIRVLHWEETNIGEFNPDRESKSTIDQAIITRDLNVQDRLSVDFKWIPAKGHYSSMNSFITTVTNAKLGGDATRLDIIAVYSQTAATLATKGLVLDLVDNPYLDFEKPWWPDSLLENSMVADKLWFASGDICVSFVSELIDVTFNKSFFPNENLYDLVDAGEWTIEKMQELSRNLYFDKDESDTKSNNDRFGIIIPWYVYLDGFFYGCNLITVDHDENHSLHVSSSYIGEKADTLSETLKKMFHTSDDGYLAQEGSPVTNIFARGDAAFLVAPPVMMLMNTNMLDTEVDYGILPMPKYNINQKEYKSVHSNFLSLFSIFGGCNEQQAARAGAVLECLASEGYRTISPVIFEKCLKLRYANDSDTGRMYDIIRAGAVFDTGRIFAAGALEGITQDVWQKCVIFNNKVWGAQAANVDAQLQSLLDIMMESFETKDN